MYFENQIPVKPMLEGVRAYSASQSTLLYMKRLNKTESPIFGLLCVPCFQMQPFRFASYFTAPGVKCHMAAVKRLSVLQHSAGYIFISFEINKPILVSQITLSCRKIVNKTESPIFALLFFVLCFQTQPFRFSFSTIQNSTIHVFIKVSLLYIITIDLR